MAVTVESLTAVQLSNPDESQVSGVEIVVRLTPPELAALVDGYDPDGASTPSASACRAVARPMAAAIAQAIADGLVPAP